MRLNRRLTMKRRSRMLSLLTSGFERIPNSNVLKCLTSKSCWRSSVELIEPAELQRQHDVEALPASSGYLQWRKGLLDEPTLEIAPAKYLALTGNLDTELRCFGVGNVGWLKCLEHLSHPRGAAKAWLVAILMDEQTEITVAIWQMHSDFHNSCEMLIKAPRNLGMDLSMGGYYLLDWRATSVCPS